MASAAVPRRPGRDYPPLLIAVVILLGLLVILPSSLNLPQSNPSQTLEYAPVPPDDESSDPPPAGNFGALSLAGSGSLGAATSDGGEGGGGGGGPLGRGAGKNPSTKRCVGNPPRQTEDPLSPPCVAHFSGDNGGPTYQGVTRDEVRVVVYFRGCGTQQGGSRGPEPLPCRSYVDMMQPPKPDEDTFSRTVRRYQQYFNDRYQTYGRFVHFWAYFDGGVPVTAESRRADAADHIKTLKPWGAFVGSNAAFLNDWESVLLNRGVHVFRNSQTDRTNCCSVAATFEKFAPLLWSVAASAEQYADIFAGAVCAQVVGRPVTFGGMAADQGQPRVLGIIRDNRKGYEGGARHSVASQERIERCGGTFVAQTVSDGSCGPDEASADMASFRDSGVTTIIWPTGPQGGDQCGGLNYANAAAAMGYYPEVVVAGNGISDTTLNGQTMQQQFWRNAFIVTPYTRADVPGERPCIQSTREVDPEANIRDTENISCAMYDVFRFVFTGIQVAGPRLTPPSMDKGFHAIPAVSSTDPRVPACFFDPGDYTCVKDSMITWWDPAGRDPSSSGGGCMRMLEGGRRYLATQFPARDIAAPRQATDPCNQQGTIIA